MRAALSSRMRGILHTLGANGESPSPDAHMLRMRTSTSPRKRGEVEPYGMIWPPFTSITWPVM